MRTHFTLAFTASLFSFGLCGIWAQKNLPVQFISAFPSVDGRVWVMPEASLKLEVDLAATKDMLGSVPHESISQASFLLSLPNPKGQWETFSVFAYDLLPPELAGRFPDISTYWGQSVSDPTHKLRLDVTYQGLHAQVLSPEGDWYIDPAYQNSTTYYHAYFKKDLPNLHQGDFYCEEVGEVKPEAPESTDNLSPIGGTRRTYRLAVATTGEYTTFHGGTVTSAMSAVTTAINRVNGIYESEFAVRMTLIPNNDILIFTNASTDPYTNDNGSTMLGQNQSTLTSLIGGTNYDIGHVFSTGGGGIASLGSVCSSSAKAQGVTGLPNPIGDAFYVDYVCHEIGHQFNGSHTFNSTSGSCSGNRSGNNAYEPGSGSTIMAYAGICSPDNVQNFSDSYFNARSFVTVRSFITGTGGACASNTASGNTPPIVNVEAVKTMPISTPFKLTATGSDADGDPITYCWEQYNRGAAIGLAATPTTGTPPLFRSFDPDTARTRYFPRLAVVVANASVPTEKLPTYTRAMTFRVTVRDNKANAGGTSYAELALQASALAGPFTVTSPSSVADFWAVGFPATVTWDVANTDQTPVNCATVNIRLSVDGGLSFPYVLVSNTANDGTETFVVPNLPGASNLYLNQCRVMVEAADNYFYNVSSGDFTVNNILGEDHLSDQGLLVYPNPSPEGLFHVQGAIGNLRVTDLSGREVTVPVSNHNGQATLDLSAQPAGMYVLMHDQKAIGKLVKP